MAKTLEQIIDESVVPDMECAPKGMGGAGRRASTVTVDQIPEVVLPKTKAEVYREAKGRLTQKPKAVSKRDGDKRKTPARGEGKRAKVKTVELEIAAVTETAGQAESEQIKYRKNSLKNPDVEPVWVGAPEETVPFAWRFPLVSDLKRPSKFYRQSVVRADRGLMLPVPRDKN